MVLSVSVFTGCKQQEEVYTGNYYVTEFVPNISDAEFNEYYKGKDSVVVTTWRSTWSQKTGYVKNEKLKDYELSSYMKDLAGFTDEEIKETTDKVEATGRGFYWNITNDENTNHDMLYVGFIPNTVQ